MYSIGPAYRRAFALFLLAGASFLLWSAFIQPLASGFIQRQSQIDEARHLLGKYEALAASRESAERALAQAESLQQSRGEFLREKTPSLGSASLQSRLSSIISANGLIMPAVRLLPVREHGSFQAISLRINLVGDLDAIRKSLHKIESNVPYFIVDNFNLKPSRVQGSNEFISMDASFDVIGFLPSEGETN